MKFYSREECLQKSVEYFNSDTLAADVFINKYALRDGDKYYELTPDDMHRRLAKEFARIEAKYPNPMSEEEIYDLFKGFRFIIPQGSPMSAIGNPFRIESCSNCIVLSPTLDSYGGILYTDQQVVQASKRRCGVGFDISNLRPKGIATKNASITTDGIALFLERFSNSIREVGQAGRRGAMMLTLDIHHPEIRTFIHIKRDRTKITGANISIRITDEFMNAVKNKTTFQLRWPIDNKENPTYNEFVDANELWDEICNSARDSAEPGLLMWGNVEKYSPAECYAEEGYKSTSTNPCSEIPMGAPFPGADSCRLLLLNLKGFIRNPFQSNAFFDFDKFAETTKKAQKLMDDLVDIESEHIDKIIKKINLDPEPDSVKQIELDLWNGIRRTCYEARRTGLGITALGDALAALSIKYGSEESIIITEKLYKTLCINAYESSFEMARDRGPFPIFKNEKERENLFIRRVLKNCSANAYKLYTTYGRRNIALLTTAPAGSVSCLTQTTSGIEPVFMLRYTRRRKISNNSHDIVSFVDKMGDKWHEYDVFHHGVQEWMNISGEKDIKLSPYWNATANEIDWNNRVKMQAAASKWVDHSISSTVNLPNDISTNVVKMIYEQAWETGCKGITVYRDGCRDGVLVQNKPEKQNQKDYQLILSDGTKYIVKSSDTIEFNGKQVKVEDLVLSVQNYRVSDKI